MEQVETVVRHRAEHNISRRNIDRDALQVLYHLSNHGFIAYLVGGGVRDLLLGRTPKDFDVGTNAHPNQVKKLFRNCYLVGRRFRLAHVKFGAKVIETSTFRRTPEPEDGADEGDLLHLRDNTFGTPIEDARRRDFTINGLFYDIKSFGVIDHVGGLRDLERRVVRSIGDPGVRFQEDPVRMIRAVRFAARLGFTVDDETWHAILKHHLEIHKAAPSRMLEEIYRLFGFSSAAPAFKLLRKSQLMRAIFPELDIYLDEEGEDGSMIWKCLEALDRFENGTHDINPVLMLGTLFYPLFVRLADANTGHRGRRHDFEVAEGLLTPVARRFQVPRAVFYELVHAFDMQRRLLEDPFETPQGNRKNQGKRPSPERVAGNPAFANALGLHGIWTWAAGLDRSAYEAWQKVKEMHPPRVHEPHGRPDQRRLHGDGGGADAGRPPAPRRRRPGRHNRVWTARGGAGGQQPEAPQ